MVRIWDHLFLNGFDAKSASAAMNCSKRTAAKRLADSSERLYQREKREDRSIGQVTYEATRPSTDRTSYPVDCLELAEIVVNDEDGEFNHQRNVLAAGMPYAEITPTDGVSRAQYDLDAVGRYQKRWQALEA